MSASTAAPFDPPVRRLCGPGPSDVHPSVLQAMQRPMVSHLDPALHPMLLEVVDMLRQVWRRADGIVLPLSATGMQGMEAGMANLVEPGDEVVIANAGFFAGRLVETARRAGADVTEVEAEWGQVVPVDQLVDTLDQHPNARLVAVVHAETSTGAQYPLAELAAALGDRSTLLMADCVTSLGSIELDLDAWGVDWAYSCTQKALAAPPGMSPVAASGRALERIAARKKPVPYAWDLRELDRYWSDRPVAYHHTVPVLHIYALHEALRLMLEEGLEARWARHADAAAHLREALSERDLELLADPAHQLPSLTAVRVPEGIDGAGIQKRLLDEHGLEVGGGLGPDAPAMWRIGLMGYNARTEVADEVIAAFDAVLGDRSAGAPARAGAAAS